MTTDSELSLMATLTLPLALAMGSAKELGMSLEEWIKANPEKCAFPENRKEARQEEIGHKGPRI